LSGGASLAIFFNPSERYRITGISSMDENGTVSPFGTGLSRSDWQALHKTGIVDFCISPQSSTSSARRTEPSTQPQTQAQTQAQLRVADAGDPRLDFSPSGMAAMRRGFEFERRAKARTAQKNFARNPHRLQSIIDITTQLHICGQSDRALDIIAAALSDAARPSEDAATLQSHWVRIMADIGKADQVVEPQSPEDSILLALAKGDLARAVLALDKLMLASANSPTMQYGDRFKCLRAMVAHSAGDRETSDALLAELNATNPGLSHLVAQLHAWRGETTLALERVTEDTDPRSEGDKIPGVLRSFTFAPIHGDPRWIPFLEGLYLLPHQVETIEFDMIPRHLP
jgi:hypothetical protein